VTTSGATVVRNTLANGLGSVLGTVIGVVLTPLVIDRLGIEAYGVWTLALTLSFAGGYAALTDVGIEAATVRHVAEAQSVGDQVAINRAVSTTLLIFSSLGVVLAIAVAIAAPALVRAFSVDQALRDAANVTFLLIGVQLVLELPARAFTAVLEGTQSFVTYQVVELSKALVNGVGTVVVLLSGGGLRGLAVVYVVMTTIGFFSYWALAHRAVPGLRAGPRNASRAELRKLLTYGTTVFGLRFTGTIHRQMDKVILGAATDPRYVGIYEIANKLQMAAAQVQGMFVSALTPATASLRQHREVLRDLYLRGTLYTAAVSLPVALGAILFAEPILSDWIGSEGTEASGPARLFLVYLLYTVLNSVGTTMLVALGRLRRLVLFAFISVSVNLAVSIALAHSLKINGVILGTLVGGGIVWWPTLHLCLREFGVTTGQWLRRIAAPQVPAIAALAAVGFPLALLARRADNLAIDLAALGVSAAVALVAFVALGVRGSTRAELFEALRGGVQPRRAVTTSKSPPE
jgi:O-antigen/teichoic acid export membrane protein